MAKPKDRRSLQDQADEILKIAEASGVQSNLLFVTTFKRYQVLLSMLTNIEKEIAAAPIVVTKQYGREAVSQQIGPVYRAYLAGCAQADATAKTLLRIIESFQMANSLADDDPLLRAINGG